MYASMDFDTNKNSSGWLDVWVGWGALWRCTSFYVWHVVRVCMCASYPTLDTLYRWPCVCAVCVGIALCVKDIPKSTCTWHMQKQLTEVDVMQSSSPTWVCLSLARTHICIFVHVFERCVNFELNSTTYVYLVWWRYDPLRQIPLHQAVNDVHDASHTFVICSSAGSGSSKITNFFVARETAAFPSWRPRQKQVASSIHW